MPRRRRTSKRRHLAGEDGTLFLFGDGTSHLLAGVDLYPDPQQASAAWEVVRAETWRHPLRRMMWPPTGAKVLDGIGDATRWESPLRMGESWRVDRVRAAVTEDVASVERFVTARPDAADTVIDELQAYVDDLRMLAGFAERLGDVRNESGYASAVGEQWSRWECFEFRHARAVSDDG